MLSRFQKFVVDNKLFTAKHKLILAVSGGKDSIVLTHLCHKAGLKFCIAHCNFGLRGKESEGDEKFVKQLGLKYKAKVYTKKFHTSNFAKKHNVSIQMAARQLRYDWFEEIRMDNKYDSIALAHHKDDEIETVFINLIRGTGISGLVGIPVKRGKIVRPLLFATRDDIESYLSQEKLLYREDSSNSSDKYIRNKLRLKVMPVLKEINPSLELTIAKNIERLKQVEQVFRATIQQSLKSISESINNTLEIDINKLKKLNPVSIYLYELLHPYGYNETVCDNILRVLNKSISGQQFFSPTHRLVRDRSKLIITQDSEVKAEVFSIKVGIKKINKPLNLALAIIKTENHTIPKSNIIACLDFDKLKFPLIIRRWKKGDSFHPLGMKTKKKLSDFFIDNKFSLIDKESTWLLISENVIVWVIGCRIDDRYKVTNKTKTIVELKLSS